MISEGRRSRPERLSKVSAIMLRANVRSIGRIREFVTGALASQGIDAEVIDDAAIIVSELATNALRYGKLLDGMIVCAYASAEGPVVEVWDRSPEPPRVMPIDFEAESGRGLNIVCELSARWGVTPLPNGGKAVWSVIRKAGD
ncbi:ATP-binding protein [Actinomadura kijaniata]|uniref:ATP-binding protein n=1 Tax=Actinomadura kijaniata TaxID=46161 RepID=UPI0014719A6A|nr:ATP-binding protein [Actinomadura kijaniata]